MRVSSLIDVVSTRRLALSELALWGLSSYESDRRSERCHPMARFDRPSAVTDALPRLEPSRGAAHADPGEIKHRTFLSKGTICSAEADNSSRIAWWRGCERVRGSRGGRGGGIPMNFIWWADGRTTLHLGWEEGVWKPFGCYFSISDRMNCTLSCVAQLLYRRCHADTNVSANCVTMALMMQVIVSVVCWYDTHMQIYQGCSNQVFC